MRELDQHRLRNAQELMYKIEQNTHEWKEGLDKTVEDEKTLKTNND